MRITIETEDGEKKAAQAEQPQAEGAAEATPPEELATRAAAMGAASAGPAPAEMMAEGPSSFVGQPGTPETTPEAGAGPEVMSAGAAPGFAAGEVQSEEAESETEEAEAEE